jgi:hypothetical protein
MPLDAKEDKENKAKEKGFDPIIDYLNQFKGMDDASVPLTCSTCGKTFGYNEKKLEENEIALFNCTHGVCKECFNTLDLGIGKEPLFIYSFIQLRPRMFYVWPEI